MVAMGSGFGVMVSAVVVLGQDTPVFLGEDIMAWMVLAIGAAMAVGNLLAIVRPPDDRRSDDDLERAPVARSIVFIVVGVVAALWALGSLIIG
jgi:hypothetical protein